MISKKMFITLMNSLEKIDKTIHGLENIFDFNMDDGPLVRAFDDIVNLLVEEMELDIDDEVGPVILHYALVNNWGEAEFKLKLNDEDFIINDLDKLYEYLSLKYIMDRNNMEVNKQDE